MSTDTPALGAGFSWLWTSSALSNLADGVLKIALPLIALRFTDSPALIAGLGVALSLPWLLFALPAGALADRWDRRRSMLGANAVRCLVLLLLCAAFLGGFAQLWVLYVAAFVIGCTETLYDTSAQSILPQLVPAARLDAANGRLQAAELTTNQFIGPPLGGVLAAGGAALAFATPAGLWLVAVGALWMVRGSFRIQRTGTATTLRADIGEGLRFLWSNIVLRVLALMVGGFNLATSAMFAVFVLYAVGPASPMGLSEPAFGLLLTATAAGAVAGSLLAGQAAALLGRSRSLLIAIVTGAVLVGLPALTANPWAIGASFLVGGLGIALWNVITVTLRQRIVPAALMGRVNSGYRLLAWGTMPLGAAAGGLLAEWIGLRPVFAVFGLLTLALLVGMVWVTDARIAQAEDDAARA
ncbi:MFS transporter [Zafaria sp. Z1313]|uniref:MFS transporter n=1 Tax=unclassified Zafaria TaxID=2828765 RepID=UPI002E796172|nr:MFS transporter [Zafaria sp. J156]MEE1620022.1 MFS transporter [Zafaria sp. J156]